MRTFQQNKLWRDKMVSLAEATGSKIEWKRLDDVAYDKELRRKLIEESQEVVAAHSGPELTSELADVLEVIQALCSLHKISWDDVMAQNKKKRDERGGFDARMFVTNASHPRASLMEQYCLNDPEKYPEIVELVNSMKG